MVEETPPTVKPKKEKAPAREDKPFGEFLEQDFFPALKAAFNHRGISDLTLTLVDRPVLGSSVPCPQVVGTWASWQFNLYFPDRDLQGRRAFSCQHLGMGVNTLEPFLIDERKITLDLMVFGVMQRLNGQKWFNGN